MKSILSIKNSEEQGKHYLKIRYANPASLFYIGLIYFLIILTIFLIIFRKYPNVLGIAFYPGAIFLLFLFVHKGLKKIYLKLSKDEDYLYFESFQSMGEHGIQKVPINELKIICIRNPFSFYFFYNILIEYEKKLHILAPMVQNLPKNAAPVLGTESELTASYFWYSKNDIKTISDFLQIPFETKNEVFGWRTYVLKFYKRR